MSVRNDRFVRTDDGFRSEDAEIFVAISGDRTRLRNNPFVVWTREVAPYSISFYVYVFDPIYDGMTVSSVDVWVNGKKLPPLRRYSSSVHTEGKIIAFEKCYSSNIQERHPNAPIYVARCSFSVNEKLPYETETNIEVRAEVVLWSGRTQRESFKVTSEVEPRFERDSGSWLRCLRLILGGGPG